MSFFSERVFSSQTIEETGFIEITLKTKVKNE